MVCLSALIYVVLPLIEVDLLNPTAASEAKAHKMKRLVPTPNSYFLEIKCPKCSATTTTFSHAHRQILCQKCGQPLGQPTGGKLKLTQQCKFRVKK
ncbi:ribosomal protein s27, putative [Entamoeba histolytica HM-1:IMSS-B]|uniref:40S ribosomal protein S27 n=4 Tax=Entamoeba histolytica TaxID=5759 RepID=C4LSR1_ENTH1|nr:40S ribosomal protein S27, putative [Entamoeba histolytica HM-1:IMSS]EAL51510.2 40S ribosomal protein S27, putative [Entamoeba histolytica HM-1:IMSS]EMD49300.1 40S ribosomal protein S27 [Entamoeba histolytica KU27]EMH74500.1 ribosomal protein s27, putative [Entamoeba histolytica HM-1:IMSS-B]ENY60567.1 40S ribosomal protein S27, putative [Entamoeba histolytica HM-1:IMSS-A]|eukprot:XP_656988.2 40S ribosomal protein S27, putative [Entamoeba histolytica HM-1:IMSS]